MPSACAARLKLSNCTTVTKTAISFGDIARPATAKAVVETALARCGTIDALVNNAGIFFTKAFIDYTFEDYRRLAGTNLEGFLHLAQQRGGSIVSIFGRGG